MRERKDRVVPLLLGTIFYVVNYYLILRLGLHPLINFYFAGATIVVLAALLITLKWKISIHMMSMGGITAFFFSLGLIVPLDLTQLIGATLILSGALGSARLILNAHGAKQVFAGYLTGFAIIMLLFLYVSA